MQVCRAREDCSRVEYRYLFCTSLPLRGLNENSNELLRHNQWLAGLFPGLAEVLSVLPQGDGIDQGDRDVQRAVDSLNHGPRKALLGFRTPFEVFFGKIVRYTKPPLSVALRN